MPVDYAYVLMLLINNHPQWWALLDRDVLHGSAADFLHTVLTQCVDEPGTVRRVVARVHFRRHVLARNMAWIQERNVDTLRVVLAHWTQAPLPTPVAHAHVRVVRMLRCRFSQWAHTCFDQ